MGQAAWLSVQLLLSFTNSLGKIAAGIAHMMQDYPVPSAELLRVLPLGIRFSPVLQTAFIQFVVDVHRITRAPISAARVSVAIIASVSFCWCDISFPFLFRWSNYNMGYK